MLFPSSEHYYEYCVCGKTGYTDQARNTLVTYAEKDGMKLICVVMGCGLGVQYADTETLFNFGFDNFSVIDASDSDERFTLKDEGIFASGDMASSTSFNIEIPEQSFVVLPSGVSLSKVDTNIQYLTDTEDGYFAEIDYLYEGMTVGSARLKMTDATPADGESFDFDSHAEQEESEAAESQGDGGLGDIWSRTKNIDVRVVIVEVVGIILIIAICIIRRIRKKDDRIRFDKKRKRRR
jgi:hypothetical protein